MPRKVVDTDHQLYDTLRQQGVGQRTATRLQNLYSTMEYTHWSIDKPAGEGGLAVATPKCEPEMVSQMVEALRAEEGAVAVVHRLCDKRMRKLCGLLAGQHPGVSASKPTLKLYFCRQGLSKQQIVL